MDKVDEFDDDDLPVCADFEQPIIEDAEEKHLLWSLPKVTMNIVRVKFPQTTNLVVASSPWSDSFNSKECTENFKKPTNCSMKSNSDSLAKKTDHNNGLFQCMIYRSFYIDIYSI